MDQSDNESHSIHLTHAALTERFKDLVVTEGCADHGGGFLPEGTRQDCSRKAGRLTEGHTSVSGVETRRRHSLDALSEPS